MTDRIVSPTGHANDAISTDMHNFFLLLKLITYFAALSSHIKSRLGYKTAPLNSKTKNSDLVVLNRQLDKQLTTITT